MAVWLISASWGKKRFIPTFQTRCTPSSGKIFLSRFELAHGCLTHFGLLSPKTFDSYFLDMMYAEFMKNFLLVDSSELMAVRLISAAWGKKHLILTFQTWCTSSSWKTIFSPISASWWLLDWFRPPELISASWAHFGLLSRKTFDSCILDMLYVEFMKNFLLADSSELMAVRLISASWAQKRLIPTF